MAASRPVALVDTSVAVPMLVGDHVDHEAVTDATRGRRLGLSGHAAFETFSVLTRMPAPARRSPAAVERLLRHNFPVSRFLDQDAAADLMTRLPVLGIAGGSVYDALVGAAASSHKLVLLTRDRRAASTYRLLDVNFEMLG